MMSAWNDAIIKNILCCWLKCNILSQLPIYVSALKSNRPSQIYFYNKYILSLGSLPTNLWRNLRLNLSLWTSFIWFLHILLYCPGLSLSDAAVVVAAPKKMPPPLLDSRVYGDLPIFAVWRLGPVKLIQKTKLPKKKAGGSFFDKHFLIGFHKTNL